MKSGPAVPADGLQRRELLKAGGALVLHAALPLAGCVRSGPAAKAGAPEVTANFLGEAELRALRAFTDRMIPADADPGAVAAHCADAIARLLSAFSVEPPQIFAGGPFSDRGGQSRNDFSDFIELDAYEALGWRLAIEGSQGLPAREFNGPVKGLQAVYREGLARLDALAVAQGFEDFAAAPAPVQDLILRDSDPAVVELVDLGFGDTLDAMYGAPEYGGNRDLVGWGFTAYDGDVQPRGYADEQVVHADNPGPLDFLLPPSYHDPATRSAQPPVRPTTATAALPAAAPQLPMAPPAEAMLSLVQAADGRISRLRIALRGGARA